MTIEGWLGKVKNGRLKMKTKGVHEKNTMSEGCRIASMEEYIILQDKIDKIGDFRFRVKGWTITIMIAVLFTGFTSSAPSWVILFAIPMIFLFQTMEGYQDLLSGAYSKRIFVLEKKHKPWNCPLKVRFCTFSDKKVRNRFLFHKDSRPLSFVLFQHSKFLVFRTPGHYFFQKIKLLLKTVLLRMMN